MRMIGRRTDDNAWLQLQEDKEGISVSIEQDRVLVFGPIGSGLDIGLAKE